MNELEATSLDYRTMVVALTRKFIESDPEEWNRLAPYLSVIEDVGSSLATNLRAGSYNEHSLHLAIEFASNMSHFVSLRSELDLLAWVEMGLEAARLAGNQARIGLFLNNLSSHYFERGELTSALAHLEEAVALFQASGDKRGEATLLTNAGKVYATAGDIQKALEYFNRALALRRNSHDSKGEAITLSALGMFFLELKSLITP